MPRELFTEDAAAKAAATIRPDAAPAPVDPAAADLAVAGNENYTINAVASFEETGGRRRPERSLFRQHARRAFVAGDAQDTLSSPSVSSIETPQNAISATEYAARTARCRFIE